MISKIIELIRDLLLGPFAFFLGKVLDLRRRFYKIGLFKNHEYALPVISVGNVSFGGTGKTPFTIWLTGLLDQMNMKTMILIRGYKGESENGSELIMFHEKYKQNAKLYGDEAILYLRHLQNGAIGIGKKRYLNLEKFYHKVKPDVVVLDDGFQHLKMARDFNILLFDATKPLKSYRTAPLGQLRENIDSIKDADCFVINKVDRVSETRVKEIKKFLSSKVNVQIPVFECFYRPLGVYNCLNDHSFAVEDLKNKKVICMAAVASPRSFFDLVQSFEPIIVSHYIYDDHYYFSATEIEKIINKAIESEAEIIMTEKDMVKVSGIISHEKLHYLKIGVEIVGGEEKFSSLLKEKIND